jgi:farnesyl diphosphate synthase
MDDIGDRWEQPSVHVKFGEATATLAGDALSALAFELLASESTHEDPSVRCQLIAGFSEAVGGHGAVGGQIHELLPIGSEADIGEITRLQQMKTGALLAFSSEAGGILGHATRGSRHALRAFAHDLGLAWQIMSDVQAEGRKGSEKLDKKASFVTVLGPDRAPIQARILAHQAAEHLDLFDENTEYLTNLVDYILTLDR